MTNLFVYGSLMYEPVWRRLLPERHARQAARLRGFQRLCMRDAVYPGLRARAGAEVDGVLVMQLSAWAMGVLDRFEGECYRRESVSVITHEAREIPCQVFVTRERCHHLLTSTEWHPQTFEQRHLARFLRANC